MRKTLFCLSLFFVGTALASAAPSFAITGGFMRTGFVDQVYSPNLYTGNGVEVGLSSTLSAEKVDHVIRLDGLFVPVSPAVREGPVDITYFAYGEERHSSTQTRFFSSPLIGFCLSYAPGFRLPLPLQGLDLRLGPGFRYKVNLVGTETYVLDMSLGISARGTLQLAEGHRVTAGIGLPVVSLLNRPAHVLFDNQIMQNFETSLVKEFFHVDRVDHLFSSDYFNMQFKLGYEWRMADPWAVSVEYRGDLTTCTLPEDMRQIAHSIHTAISLYPNVGRQR